MVKKAGPPSKPGKTSKAPLAFNAQISALVGMAASAPLMKFKERKSAAKLFELAVMAELLLEYQARTTGKVTLVNPGGGNVARFAGAPARADRSRYSFFQLHAPVTDAVVAEGWVSVQFTGLSARLAAKSLGAGKVHLPASRHELDLMLVMPNPGAYPQFDSLIAAVSLKHVSRLHKESVREALGFRREMGLLAGPRSGPSGHWLEPTVPASPAVPLYLISSAANFDEYETHVDELGVYARYMQFPY